MKAFFDTSVLIAAMVESHVNHKASFKLFQKVYHKKIKGFVSSHSLAECYSVLSKYPIQPTLNPLDVYELIQNNILNLFELSDLTNSDYKKVIREMSLQSFRGGIIYDALIYQAALKSKCDVFYTWNLKDFLKLSEAQATKVLAPSD